MCIALRIFRVICNALQVFRHWMSHTLACTLTNDESPLKPYYLIIYIE